LAGVGENRDTPRSTFYPCRPKPVTKNCLRTKRCVLPFKKAPLLRKRWSEFTTWLWYGRLHQTRNTSFNVQPLLGRVLINRLQTTELMARLHRRLELGALGNHPTVQIVPQRHQQAPRQRHDADSPLALAASAKALMKPPTQRTVGLIA
jgi:hypothetical protein